MEPTMMENPTLKSQAYSLEEEQIALLDSLDLENLKETLVTKEMDVRTNYGPSGQFNDSDILELNIDELIKNPNLELPLSPVECDFVEEEMKPETSQNLEDFEKNFDFDKFLAGFKGEVEEYDDQQFSSSEPTDEPCLKRAHLDFDEIDVQPYGVDSKYRERRRKNNIASKRSRQIRKEKNAAQGEEVVNLERQNDSLRRKVKELEAQNKEFREKLMVLLCKK